MKKHLAETMAFVASVWSTFGHQITTAALAFGPGLGAMVYWGVKIYFKIKRERERDRERRRWG